MRFGLALLKEEGTVLAENIMSGGAKHFGTLMPALDFLFSSLKADTRALEGIIVAKGPGSFTGLRVGMSLAKGLSHALDIPIVAVSSLEALASQVPFSDFTIGPILDSRRGEVFAAQFTWREGFDELVRQKEDIWLKLEDLPSFFRMPTLIIGNDFALQEPHLRALFGHRLMAAPAHFWNLRASAVGSLGLKRFHAGEFDDSASLNPLYLRAPDIRPNSSGLTQRPVLSTN